jgi:hypothetical protein
MQLYCDDRVMVDQNGRIYGPEQKLESFTGRCEVLRGVLLKIPVFIILAAIHITVKHILPHINTQAKIQLSKHDLCLLALASTG